MKIGVYYGGRGVIDDPTLFVLEKMEKILSDELDVEVFRYNIYEHKQEISTLPKTMNGLNGIILATTVEWNGIGGFMHQFLDACWFYGNKENIAQIYMQPIVMSTTYGEREGMMSLENAWEILGGLPCGGMCGYVGDLQEFRQNESYLKYIEKKTEELHRTISNRIVVLPTSNQEVKSKVLRTPQINMTPIEADIAADYASDDNKVRRQKADIVELSQLYANMLGESPVDEGANEFIDDFNKNFHPTAGFKGSFLFTIQGKRDPLFVGVDNDRLICEYASHGEADVFINIDRDVMIELIGGRKTFQGAFSTASMSVHGQLMLIRYLDELFPFGAR